MVIENFNGRIVKNAVDSKKLDLGKKIRTLTIADLHGYTSNEKKAKRLAEVIKREEPDIIFIAGDIFNTGYKWEGGAKLEQFRRFIQNLSEVAPVCISWGNHDMIGMTEDTKDERIKNLRELENARPGKVFPLYNDKVFINGMEIIGFVPPYELMGGPGLKTQVHGRAHDDFIKLYNANGIKFENKPGYVTVNLGHDPHLIAAAENDIGLGDLSVCDFFIAGHLHDGYKVVLEFLERMKKRFSLRGKGFKSLDLENSLKYDLGWTDQPGRILDKDGNPIKRGVLPFYFGKINLCRGIVYFDDAAQQKFLQTPDGTFCKNIATEANVQTWEPVLEETARNEILKNNLHFMLISEGIEPAFMAREKNATINVVDIEGKKRKRK